MRIILASGSASRKMAMDSIDLNYEIIPAEIDEYKIRDNDLKIQAQKIAEAKVEFVAKSNEGIIIAADTFGSVNGEVLEKPKSLDEAKNMLKLQSEKECVLYTGFCYIDTINKIQYSDTAVTKYTFRKLSDEEISNFVENNSVMKWSAAFLPTDPYQAGFLKEIDGSLAGLVYGLPMELLIPQLIKSGIKLFSK